MKSKAIIKPHRDERTIHIVKELAMEFMSREANRTSLVTVTNVILGDRAKKATILLSVLPEDKGPVVEEFANRKCNEFRSYVKARSKLGIIPFFNFKIDLGEINRQNIDRMLK
jgi:ribosome-binding factor A